MSVVWSTKDWARAIAGIERTGALPSSTVLVPRAAVAHALRKELVRLERHDVLAGTLFVSPVVAAGESLGNAGVLFQDGEESLRAARVRSLFRGGVALAYFGLGLLREAQGWDVAFARTLGELEMATFRAEDLERAAARATTVEDSARLRDVATIWRAANDAAGSSWTRGRILEEAAKVLTRTPDAWPYPGPTLAVVTGHEGAAEARLLRAIPGLELVGLAARPAHAAHLEGCEATFGADFAAALRDAPVPRDTGSERALLRSYLFDPAALEEKRPRSAGPDGTVYLEEHAGIDEEIEAAADWVARLVLERGTPLEEIGLLLASLDPAASMLVDRLARRGIASHVSGGVPACTAAAGARALAVVRALQGYLGFEELAEVLPVLRLQGNGDGEELGRVHLARGAARELAFGLGTVGGNAGHPAGALEWTARLDARRESLARAVKAVKGDDDDERERERQARLLANIGAIEPALTALVGLAEGVIAGATLEDLAPRLASFLGDWLLTPGSGKAAIAIFTGRLDALAGDATCGSLKGDDALRVIEEALLALRIPRGRFGDASVHIDTVAGAVGLPFQAVRLLGLVEGALPSVPREDAVLPERLRDLVGGARVSRVRRTLGDLHAVARIVRDTRDVVVLSAPRLGADRSYREPSSLFIDVATALGRPNAATRQRDAIVPDGRALRRDAFAPARAEARAFRFANPIGESAWHDRAARVAAFPARWRADGHLDPTRLDELRAIGGSLDGLLAEAARALRLPGLSPERALSASALAMLLGCPHRFLFERGFGWREPADAPSARELDPLSYGTLFHSVAERFFLAHGARFGERGQELAAWLPLADDFADAALDEVLEHYPLTGSAARETQRDRLREDVAALLEHELAEAKARFAAAEKAFGCAEPMVWPTRSGPLYLTGYIDRLDVVAKTTRVRDLKTGKAHARKAGSAPDPARDVQIALYALVTAELAGSWGVPARVSAQYVYASARGVVLRSWDGEMEALLASGKEWLELAGTLLHAGELPRSPNEEDCSYCSFQAACGGDRNARAARVLEGTPRLQALRVLKESA